jgi:hypothetical protein
VDGVVGGGWEWVRGKIMLLIKRKGRMKSEEEL